MQVISSEKDFSLIYAHIDSVIDKSKALPDKVFRSIFKYFLFITYDELFMALFFNHIKQYLIKIGEKEFWLTAINSDTNQNGVCNFKIVAAIQYSVSDSEDGYLSALNGFSDDSPPSVHMHYSDSLIALSSCCKWTIFGNIEADIAICGFSDRAQMEIFRSVYSSDLLNGVDAAAEYAYGACGDASQIEKFRKNFFSD